MGIHIEQSQTEAGTHVWLWCGAVRCGAVRASCWKTDYVQLSSCSTYLPTYLPTYVPTYLLVLPAGEGWSTYVLYCTYIGMMI